MKRENRKNMKYSLRNYEESFKEEVIKFALEMQIKQPKAYSTSFIASKYNIGKTTVWQWLHDYKEEVKIGDRKPIVLDIDVKEPTFNQIETIKKVGSERNEVCTDDSYNKLLLTEYRKMCEGIKQLFNFNCDDSILLDELKKYKDSENNVSAPRYVNNNDQVYKTIPSTKYQDECLEKVNKGVVVDTLTRKMAQAVKCRNKAQKQIDSLQLIHDSGIDFMELQELFKQ